MSNQLSHNQCVELEALDMHLARALAPLYIIASDELLLAQEAADKIRATARARGYGERQVFVIEPGFQWNAFLFANQTPLLFSDKKIIELRMPNGKPGKEGSQALKAYTAQLNHDNMTLISLPKLDEAMQKSAWLHALQQVGVSINIPLITRAQLPSWLGKRLMSQQQHASQACLECIADYVEGNLLAAHQEIQKLALLYPAGTLTLQQIQAALCNVARYDIFKLNAALLSGDQVRFVRIAQSLQAEGCALPLILWALAEEIRTLLKLKLRLLTGSALAILFKEHRIWGTRAQLIERALQRLDMNRLQWALQKAAAIDKMIKGITAGDPWVAVAQLGSQLA